MAVYYAMYLYNNLPNEKVIAYADFSLELLPLGISLKTTMFWKLLCMYWIPNFKLKKNYLRVNLALAEECLWVSAKFIQAMYR